MVPKFLGEMGCGKTRVSRLANPFPHRVSLSRIDAHPDRALPIFASPLPLSRQVKHAEPAY